MTNFLPFNPFLASDFSSATISLAGLISSLSTSTSWPSGESSLIFSPDFDLLLPITEVPAIPASETAPTPIPTFLRKLRLD